LTVPACRICSQLYTALDRCRDEYIYRPNSHDPVIRTINKVDEGNLTAEIVHKARKVLKQKANHFRQRQIQRHGHGQDEGGQEEDQEDVPESHLEGEGRCGVNEESEEEEAEAEDEFEIPEESTKIISPSQMVSNTSPSAEQQSLQRRKSELLQGHQLGGTTTSTLPLSSNQQSHDRKISSSKLIKQVGGNHSSGSFPVWVDLMVAAASTPRDAGGGGGLAVSNHERKEKKVTAPSMETLERRKSIQMLRKVEKMDWRMMLRDDTTTKPLLRPRSAGALNSTSRQYGHQTAAAAKSALSQSQGRVSRSAVHDSFFFDISLCPVAVAVVARGML
jgi:hypothetical protein